ncbi:hypothetical protein J3F83DRAFT_420371 [Trichoderma novae-zelandiae]
MDNISSKSRRFDSVPGEQFSPEKSYIFFGLFCLLLRLIPLARFFSFLFLLFLFPLISTFSFYSYFFFFFLSFFTSPFSHFLIALEEASFSLNRNYGRGDTKGF